MSETNQKWKYVTSQHFHAEDDHKLCEKFDYYGYLGWELVCVVPYPDEGLSIAHWKQTEENFKNHGNRPPYPGRGNW